jgi:hypothetical protein
LEDVGDISAKEAEALKATAQPWELGDQSTVPLGEVGVKSANRSQFKKFRGLTAIVVSSGANESTSEPLSVRR